MFHAGYLPGNGLGGATVWGDEHAGIIYEQKISLDFYSAIGYGCATKQIYIAERRSFFCIEPPDPEAT
jgi:hypothetical protein